MDLEGYVVESVDSGGKNQAGEQPKNASNALQPIPVLMPEPQVIQPGNADASSSNGPNSDTKVKMPEPNYNYEASNPVNVSSQPLAGTGVANVSGTNMIVSSAPTFSKLRTDKLQEL
jgi:hypothetical protein